MVAMFYFVAYLCLTKLFLFIFTGTKTRGNLVRFEKYVEKNYVFFLNILKFFDISLWGFELHIKI